jgi:hypothetical protein
MEAMTPSVWIRTAVGVLVLGAAACENVGTGNHAMAVRDSAGIRIVESRWPAWGDAGRWAVEPVPAVDIGVADGAAEYQFGQVRGAARLSDGTVVVADGTSRQLRFFDPAGRFVRTVGRGGGGPGEFQSLDGVLPYRGDSVAAWDARQRRLSIFTVAGTYVRAATVADAAGLSPGIRGVFPDGSFVLEPSGSLQAFLRMQAGERRDSVSYVRVSPQGALADTLSVQADREIAASRGGAVLLQQSVLFGRDSYLATGEGRAYAGQSDAFRIDVVDPRGTPMMSIRRNTPPRPVSGDDLRRARAAALSDRRDRDAQISRMTGAPAPASAEPLPSRPTMPAFDHLIVDSEGYLWVRDFVVDRAAPSRWSIFDASGAWLGTVELPPGLYVSQIGPDWVLGRTKDELDVEHVRLYRLSRG